MIISKKGHIEIEGSAIDYLDGREMEILYFFEKRFPSKRNAFDVLDRFADKIIPEDDRE